MEDSRFSKFKTDPKFRNVPKKQRKVQIDERFQSMFKDKKFVSKVSVDKRGRPGNYSTKENFEKFYHLENSDEEDDTDDENKASNDMGTAVKDTNVDYARGEAVLSDSSSEEEGDDDTDEDVEIEEEEVDETDFDKWGELDHDADETEEVTNRLAVCNMDWDRVGADDLFLALSSFCPPGGRLLKVSVYLSEFGKTRLAEEDQLGPVELRQESKRKQRKESEAEAMERIRKYQVNRLKYYYAVAEFNSPIAANCVYSQCDGNEYELSATRFDLRFIPDEMQFQDDGPPKDVCDAPPDSDKYKPKYFSSSALSLGKVDLTWDETDPERISAMQKAFANDDDDDDKLKAYFANSSDDEEEEGEEEVQSQQEFVNDEHNADFSEEKDEDVIAKYRALLGQSEKSVENDEEEDNSDEEDDGTGMEMTYIPDEDRKKQADALKVQQMTPWEKYLHKKKEKRKQKKERTEKKEATDEDEDDDDIPSDVKNDPFFQEELKTFPSSGKVVENSSVEKADDFSLLVMDSDDDKAHFDYKEIVKKSSSSKRQKKRKKNNRDQVDPGDDFQMDVKDPRFAAIFHNPKYNVDPSHPGFKKTKAMKSIIEEKQSRIVSNREIPTEQIEEPKMKKPKRSILSLADSVALKTSKKKKRKSK